MGGLSKVEAGSDLDVPQRAERRCDLNPAPQSAHEEALSEQHEGARLVVLVVYL